MWRDSHVSHSVRLACGCPSAAACLALACLAKEKGGGPAQESITEEGGIALLTSTYREATCTDVAKQAVQHALRYLASYEPAKTKMRELGVLQGGSIVL